MNAGWIRSQVEPPAQVACSNHQVIAGQKKVNDILEGTKFPRISDEIIHNIIYEV